MPRKEHVTCRLDAPDIARIDALTLRLVRPTLGMLPHRTFGVRAAILRGLEAYEDTFLAADAEPATSAPKATPKPKTDTTKRPTRRTKGTAR